jgi:alpha-galactosidase
MNVRTRRRFLVASTLTGIASSVPLAAKAGAQEIARLPQRRVLAPSPPLGWNSWNSFATTIDEAQTREIARIMAEKLLPFGYKILTVDIQWYEPHADGYSYRQGAELCMDEFGRLLPAPNRFPGGFSSLAAEIHRLGMQFGIHLMRGIPRQAVRRNTRILGTPYRARDIADLKSTCDWNGDMYGVDMSKPGAQAYYDSVFSLYASWGVDFVKMDDMSRPYARNWPEIEAAHRAITATGRPIILSLSPGETDLKWAQHVGKYAQMWRIADDFWDEWKLLKAQFERLERWNPSMGPDTWPDADMLPLGRLALGARDSRFTPDEQQTLMTLWSIARSPLIMGGDLRHLDAPTLALLTNPEVLAVNQRSEGNRPQAADPGTRIWSARPAGGQRGQYLALFNTEDHPVEIDFDLSRLDLGNRRVACRDLWARRDLGTLSGTLRRTLPPHGSALLRLTAEGE